MTKGKPWPVEDERKLRDRAKEGLDLDGLVASFEGKYTRNAVYQKMAHIGLKRPETPATTIHPDWPSSPKDVKLNLPEELPSFEESLKTMKGASAALQAPGLTNTDVVRLRAIILSEKTYQEQFPKYAKYRELENEIIELRRQLASKKENENKSS